MRPQFRSVFGVSKEFEIAMRRDCEVETMLRYAWRICDVARPWVCGIVLAGNIEHSFGVGRGKRKNRHTVERLTGRYDTARADPAKCGFESDQIVEAGGHAARASSVRTKGKADETKGYSDCRAGA